MNKTPDIFNDDTEAFMDDLSMIFSIVTGLSLKKFAKVNDIDFQEYRDLYKYLDYDQLMAVTVLMTNNSHFDRSKIKKPLRKYLLAHTFVENFPELIDREEGLQYLAVLSKKVTPEMLVT